MSRIKRKGFLENFSMVNSCIIIRTRKRLAHDWAYMAHMVVIYYILQESLLLSAPILRISLFEKYAQNLNVHILLR